MIFHTRIQLLTFQITGALCHAAKPAVHLWCSSDSFFTLAERDPSTHHYSLNSCWCCLCTLAHCLCRTQNNFWQSAPAGWSTTAHACHEICCNR